jgi:hypothetical protein
VTGLYPTYERGMSHHVWFPVPFFPLKRTKKKSVGAHHLRRREDEWQRAGSAPDLTGPLLDSSVALNGATVQQRFKSRKRGRVKSKGLCECMFKCTYIHMWLAYSTNPLGLSLYNIYVCVCLYVLRCNNRG